MIPIIMDMLFGRLSFNPIDRNSYRGTRIMGADIFKALTLKGRVLLQDKEHSDWCISYRLLDQKMTYKLHFRETDKGMRMHVMLRGHLLLKKQEGPPIELKPDDYFFANLNQYKLMPRKGGKAVMMVLHIERLSTGLSDNPSVLIDNGIYQLSTIMKDTVNDMLYHSYNDILLDEFYDLSIREMFFRHLNTNNARLSGTQKGHIQYVLKAADLINDDLGVQQDIVQMAHLVGSNDFTVKSGTRQMFRLGLGQYRMQQRMRMARKLLATTEMPVHEIAIKVGYRTTSGFITQFVKLFSLTPLEWRATHKNQPA